MQAVVDEIVLTNVNPLKVLNLFTLDSSYNHWRSSDLNNYIFDSIQAAGI